jgi:hypothetical protein
MADADSAGVPWEGRHFEPNTSADDDGSAPPRLIEAIRRFRAREVGEEEVVDALRESRLLIPLIAELGDHGVTEEGHLVDKSQELSIVKVAGPDGRTVQPVFTSVAAMAAWNREARPIPAASTRVALAAVDEGTDVVVLDPTSATEFAVRRPALWAIAQSARWRPSYLDQAVLEEFMRAAEPELAVREVQLAPGDADARLAGPELVVRLALEEGLDRHALTGLMQRLRDRWNASEIIAERVDSLSVQVVSAV